MNMNEYSFSSSRVKARIPSSVVALQCAFNAFQRAVCLWKLVLEHVLCNCVDPFAAGIKWSHLLLGNCNKWVIPVIVMQPFPDLPFGFNPSGKLLMLAEYMPAAEFLQVDFKRKQGLFFGHGLLDRGS